MLRSSERRVLGHWDIETKDTLIIEKEHLEKVLLSVYPGRPAAMSKENHDV